MLFNNLRASTALGLEGYTDFDHFRESERYARAESIPLSAKDFRVLRAVLSMPSSTLSLVRTFPRIINGYDFSEQLLIVIPMDGNSSTRLNGESVRQSLILIKGKANCTVVEPESRLVALLSIRPQMLDRGWLKLTNGHLLLQLPRARLLDLQTLIRGMLEFAALEPDAMSVRGVLDGMQETLLAVLDEALCSGTFHGCGKPTSLSAYKTIVDRVDDLLGLNPLDAANERLADEIGISVRTLQTASQSICGLPVHRYSRLKRLWSVRRQLRSGAPGLTVKSSALAHGFWHLSQFTFAYCQAFGELPSSTLVQAKLRGPTPQTRC